MSLQETLKALADPTRRQIIQLLKSGRLSAGDIGEHFSITAAISRHLSVLKEAGLIRATREGKYKITRQSFWQRKKNSKKCDLFV